MISIDLILVDDHFLAWRFTRSPGVLFIGTVTGRIFANFSEVVSDVPSVTVFGELLELRRGALLDKLMVL